MQVTFSIAHDEGTICLTNDGWDNDNYITLVVGSETVDVPIDNLLQACNLFKEIRASNIEHSKRCG